MRFGSEGESAMRILCISGNGHGGLVVSRPTVLSLFSGQDVAYTLSASTRHTGDGHGNAWNSNYRVANPLPGHHPRQDLDNDTYIAHTLSADGFDASEDGTGRGTPLVAVGVTIHGTDKTQKVASFTDIAGSLRTKPPGSQENSSTTAIMERSSVRRLTPVECERLQGFPDDWTKLDDNTPDGPRYKACGNAVSVPVIQYLGERMLAVLSGGTSR